MRIHPIMLMLALTACDKSPPLPPELPRADADLMKPLKPLPALDERKPVGLHELYTNNVAVRGVCVPDRRRYQDLQRYVKGLTE